VALRKLVEQARRDSKDADRIRQAQESAYRFMSAMAGNELGYEERCVRSSPEILTDSACSPGNGQAMFEAIR